MSGANGATRVGAGGQAGEAQPLLAVASLTKHFPLKGGLFNRTKAVVQAVDDVSFDVQRGETLGIVGESGCGKSTTARLLMHLIPLDTGSIVFDGLVVGAADGLSDRDLHRQMQMVFQDSYASLNPRLPVAMSIAFGPFVHGLAKATALKRAMELLEAVGLDPVQFANRYPHELSGGQQQRVGLCRAMMLQPPLFLLDEPFGALDPVTRNDIQREFLHLQQSEPRTIVLVTHDLREALRLGQRLIVLERGRIAQHGPGEEIVNAPANDFVRTFFQSHLNA